MNFRPSIQKLVACAILLFVTTLLLKAQAPTHTRRFAPVLDANINGFYEYLPGNYAADITTRYPLIIFFHGVGESGSVQDNATLDKVMAWGPPQLINNKMLNKPAPAVQFPDSFFVGGQWFKFIVLSPQIKEGLDGPTVTDTIRPAAVDAVIEFAKANYRVDLTRVYLCGLSMGGGATWDYAGSSAAAVKKLAAIVVACGAGDLTTAEANIIAAGKLPVLATHNKGDGTVNYLRTDANAAKINAYLPLIVPAPVIVKWNGGGHNVWSRTYEDINPGVTSQGLTGNLRDSIGMNVYEWMLQFTRLSVTLPLNWESFTVKESRAGAVLRWSTAQQINTTSYTIERSDDGTRWIAVATIAAQDNAGLAQQYQFTDTTVQAFPCYYRIRQTDLDGAFTFSAVQKYMAALKKMSATVFPNPFSQQIQVHCSGITQKSITIQLVNQRGQVLLQQQHTMISANDIVTLNHSKKLSQGIYHVIVSGAKGEVVAHSRLVKE
ncbi:MAG: T9SS type A sorting domain-containing protein [Chitinophagaceae bacterium]